MKKQEMKSNPVLFIMKTSLLDLPSPASISFLWNMGFMLGLTLMLQILTGLVISMHYTADTNTAFSSVIHIMRDLDSGWIMRFVHLNGASLFFILIYMHSGRGIYFASPSTKPKVWYTGLSLLILLMATSFLGYVLPWGQMSFWGAAVITNLFSAFPLVGSSIVQWLWGNFSVSQPTLNRFFSLHFITPMALTAMVIIHLIMLHEKGSSTPTGTSSNMDKVKFHPIFSYKDLLPLVWMVTLLLILVTKTPDSLGDVENMNPANPLSTPIHIQPEWYFLFAYAILRSIPSKLGGVMALFSSILVLFLIPNFKPKKSKFNPNSKLKIWFFVSVFIVLTWIGANPVEQPFENIGKTFTVMYFISIINF